MHIVGILRVFFLFVEVVGHVLDLLRGLEQLLVARVRFARFSHQRCGSITPRQNACACACVCVRACVHGKSTVEEHDVAWNALDGLDEKGRQVGVLAFLARLGLVVFPKLQFQQMKCTFLPCAVSCRARVRWCVAPLRRTGKTWVSPSYTAGRWPTSCRSC